MFFLLSKLLEFLIKPLIWVLILLLFSVFNRNPRRRYKFAIAALIVFFFFTNNFIADEFMRAWEVPSIEDTDINGKYDVGIVLGGVLAYDLNLRRPQFDRGADRVFQAIKLYREGKIRKLLLDGGSGSIVQKNELEAPVLKQYLIDIGIPDTVIAIEPRSRNTRENAFFARPILDSLAPHGKYLLITSASHMRRANPCFSKTGIAVTSYSVDRYSGPRKFVFDHLLIPDKYALVTWDVLLHELIGYLTYKMMGYI